MTDPEHPIDVDRHDLEEREAHLVDRELPMEADEADAADQSREVPMDEDEQPAH
jgi:hypothetical protein